MLKKVLDFPIHRYLLSNSCDRLDGYEKAMVHQEISQLVFEFIACKLYTVHDCRVVKKIHDYLAEILTDRLDEVIGFPITTPWDPYDETCPNLFFDTIIDHINEIKQRCF